MRHSRENRNFSPQYGHSSRDIDCLGGNSSHHMAVSRQAPFSGSPPQCNRHRRQSPERSDFGPQRLDRANQDCVYQYQPRGMHSPPAPYSPHDLYATYTDLNHRAELNPELEPQPMVTQKFDSFDYGVGSSQSAKQKQQSVATSGSHHLEFYRRHLRNQCEDHIDPRVNRNISSEYDRSRHHAECVDVPGDTASHHKRPRDNLSSHPCNHRLRQSSERSDFRPQQLDHGIRVSQEYLSHHQSRHRHSTVRHCPHDPHANYKDVNHYTELSSGIKSEPMVIKKSDSLDPGLFRCQPATQKHESSLTSGSHCMWLYNHHLEDPCGEDRGRATDRTAVLRQREVPHTGTTEPSNLRFIEGGSSPYQHNSLHYEPHCVSQDISRVTHPQSPDRLLNGRQSRYQVDDRYADIVGDDAHKKVPYLNPNYSSADGNTCYSRSVKEGKVSTDPLNHSRLRDMGNLPRSLHSSWVQKDGYESDTDDAISQRERKENSVLSDSGKGLYKAYYSPIRDTNVDAMEYEPSHLPVRGNRFLVHPGYNYDENHVDTGHEFQNIDVANVTSDAEDGDYEVGYNQRRTPVHDRLSLSSPAITGYKPYTFKQRLGMPCVMHSHYAPNTMVDSATELMNSVKKMPCVMHSHYAPNTMVDSATELMNNAKKRQYPYPSDFARNNSQASKFQKNCCVDYIKSNARYSNYVGVKCSDEDAIDGGSPVKDPQEGSEEFNRQVERAFLTYLREINDSAWEKKKYFQPWEGSIHCYVCGRKSSKEFAETHDLVMHTFYTQKPGLKAAHRGLHKALCLSFGWNWSVAPDLSKQYKVGPSDDAEKLKGELILWPPIVVIRNISIESKVSKVVSLKAIECMLKEIIGEGKLKLSFGKPSDQSVILVKLPPLYSGFFLAEKLHNKFAQSNHGKEHLEFFLKSRSDAKIDKETKEIENEDVLYGYIAGIEDLDKLDSVTKKMYKGQKDIFKSRKEIVATAARDNEHAVL